jgi:hypothetical protein
MKAHGNNSWGIEQQVEQRRRAQAQIRNSNVASSDLIQIGIIVNDQKSSR